MDDDERRIRIDAAIACLHAGLMSVSDAADMFNLQQSMLWKRCKAIGFNPIECRAERVRRLARVAVYRQWKLPRNWKRSRNRTARTKEFTFAAAPAPKSKPN